MNDIERQLLTYDDLPADERHAVDAYLSEHPEAGALLQEGRTLRALLDDAGRLSSAVPDAETIAHYLAAQHMAHRPLPEDIAALGRRIEASFAEHPEVERQVSLMQARLKTLMAEAESPRAQFERLVGRRLGARRQASAREPSAPAAPSGLRSARPHRAADRAASRTDRPAQPVPLRRVSFSRLAVAATLTAALLYGGLFAVSQSGQTRYARLADLGAVEQEFPGLRLRGPDGQVDEAADHYADALEALRNARTSVLGLFPRYDSKGLAETLRHLEQVVTFEERDSALALEAWFLIGKILLHEGEADAARSAFEMVVERQGPSAPDAQRLLDSLPTSAGDRMPSTATE